MKKNIHYITIAAAFVAVAAMIIGCKPNITPAQDTTAPAEVTELKPIPGNGKISLSWVNPADADLHQVEISATPAEGTLANPVYLSAEKGKAMSFTAEGLTNGTAYTFTVKTIDKALNKSTGVSTAEAVKPIDTSDKTPPAEITDLKADVKGNAILLSWKNPADDDLYQVKITVSPQAGSLAHPIYLKAQKGATGSFSVEGLANGTEYTFTVQTIDAALNESTGATVKKTIQQGENTLVAYSDLDGYLSNTASSTGINYITITGLTPDLVTGKNWYEGYRVPSPLGKILKAHSDKRVALTLPSVSALGDNAFVDCISLTSVTMSEGIASIGNGAFKSCTGLTSISIPNTVIGIGTEAFAACTALTGITLPEGLERINERAFIDCTSLKSISIPDTVRYMSNEVFKNCIALETVHLSTEINGIDNDMFYNCINLKTITIPNKVNNIGISAFQNCESLTNITIPNSVTYMSDRVFKNCTALETVHLSTEINWIGKEMFYNCVSLNTITIPNKVNHIGDSAFQNCKSLTNITIPNHVASIEGGAFSGCTGLTEVELPASINDLTSGSFSGCTSLTKLTVDSGNATYSSEGNTIYTKNTNTLVCVAGGLTSVTIPNGVTKIGWGAFGGCIHLTEVKLPASINQLQGNPFSGFTNLTTLTVDDGNATYGSAGNMIYTKDTNTLICVAPGLAGSVTVPANVHTISHFAFSNCTKLESVTISNGVSSICKTAFENCKRLTRITIPQTVSFIQDGAIWGCTNAEIVLAEGITAAINILDGAFGEEETLCKKVKIKNDANYEALKNKVVASGYPEDRIEKY